MTDESDKQEVFLIKPPKTLKDMTREERRAWAAELHAQIVAAMTAEKPD